MKIETEEEYYKALKRHEELFEIEDLGEELAQEFLQLSQEISDYEDIHYPIAEPDTINEEIDSLDTKL